MNKSRKEPHNQKNCNQNGSLCHAISRVSLKVTTFLENIFYRWGKLVANWPKLTISFSLLACAAFTCGMIFWYQEMDQEVLWTPYGSPFIEQKKWIADNFPRDRRFENLILVSDNVLTADTLRYFSKIDEELRNYIVPENEMTLDDLCLRYPDLKSGSDTLGDCLSYGIFGYIIDNVPDLDELTDEYVQSIITLMLSQEPSLEQFLSGLTYSVNGTIVRAGAVMNIWLLADNATSINDGNKDAMKWELGYINITVDSLPANAPENLTVFSLAERSYDDEIMFVVYSNFSIFIFGFVLLFFYIMIVLGDMNWIEQRALLSISGMIVIALSLGASHGLAFYLQIPYNDMCPVIPFLLLGIGVDDMFVIVQCLDNLDEKATLSVEERVAKAMQHAGVSILVTSFTDAITFFIGSTTSMPVLRQFCYFCALGVIFLFLFASSFFVACLLLDERRKERQKASRPDWNPPSWTRAKPGKFIFKKWISPIIVKKPVVAVILAITVGLAGAGIYGVINIESDYDSIWYMRHESYPYQYFKALGDHFSEQGERVDVYVGNIDYETNRKELEKLVPFLQENKYIRNESIRFWYNDFLEYLESQNDTDENSFMSNVGYFFISNNQFLQDIKMNISFSDEDLKILLESGEFQITASRATFQHYKLENTTIRNKAMDSVKSAMNEIVFDEPDSFSPIPYTMMYVQWEANKVISTQLIRNLGLAFGAIAIVNLLLIADVTVSILVFLCVALTLLDIAGGAYFMGLTIEIVTSIILILAVGLALDYSAHIGVTYVVSRGTDRKQRTQDTLNNIGTAVFNGGFSTLLAFVLVAFSDSYVFLTFFKMFACVVVFGLFHGLFVLPALLSLIGPTSIDIDLDDQTNDIKHENKSTKL